MKDKIGRISGLQSHSKLQRQLPNKPFSKIPLPLIKLSPLAGNQGRVNIIKISTRAGLFVVV